VRASAKATIADVDAKMGDLERIQAALTDLVPTRRGKGPTSECPMLNALEEQGGSRDDR
jgi:MerR family mercuric resistance operon transcriptional regulator